MDIFEKLEWNKITDDVKNCAQTYLGKVLCDELLPIKNINSLKLELTLLDEAKKLFDSLLLPPVSSLKNIEQILQDIKIQQILSEEEILEVINCLKISRLTKGFFDRNVEFAQNINKLTNSLYENKEFEDRISDMFDANGELKSDASRELKSLTIAFKDNSVNLKNTVDKMVASLSDYLQDPIVTMRDGHYVFPVKVEHKAHVKGIVHDVSASGSTLFVEPNNIVELNNKVIELELKIEREIKRILGEITSEIALFQGEVLRSYKIIGKVDFVFAKARYAAQIQAVLPELNDNKFVSIKGFKHPILTKIADKVIENDIELGLDYDCLVITGSNTGGKTVVLKSVALCVLMAEAGLFVPAKAAKIYPFKNVFADIGDEQSIEQSLSTFSGHLKNIIDIINSSNDETLILLDEIGAGTDPSEGSALAQAILEYLNNLGAKTIVTTHYGELKSLAYTHERFENASVQFDTELLKPTYKLLTGIPGKSNAINIAQNLGLDENIANKANEIYLTQKDLTGQVLEGLQNAQQKLDKENQIAQEKKENIEKLEADYKEKLEKVREQRRKTVDIYKKKYEAKIILAKTEIKQILDEIRKTKSEKVIRRSFVKLSDMQNQSNTEFDKDMEEIAPVYRHLDWSKVKAGDSVYHKKLNQVVLVLNLPDKNGNLQVKVGDMSVKVNKKDLYFTDKKITKNPQIKIKKGFEFKRDRASSEIDLRGMRVLDALDKLDKYLDEVNLSNLPQVKIIHGAGTGALRQAIREYLKDSPYVAKFRAGEDFEGSDGVSIVDIK